MNPKLTCSKRQWLHSSVGRASHWYREVTGSSPVEVLNFFQASLRNCKNCGHNCEDHSSFDFNSYCCLHKVLYCKMVVQTTRERVHYLWAQIYIIMWTIHDIWFILSTLFNLPCLLLLFILCAVVLGLSDLCCVVHVDARWSFCTVYIQGSKIWFLFIY